MRDKLIAAGVRDLEVFGYPNVNAENILTDALYSAFFSGRLKDNLGKAGNDVDEVITQLIKECEK